MITVANRNLALAEKQRCGLREEKKTMGGETNKNLHNNKANIASCHEWCEHKRTLTPVYKEQ